MGTLQTVYGEAVNDFSLLEWSRRSTSTLPTLTKTRSVLKNKTNSRGPPYITRLPSVYILPGFPEHLSRFSAYYQIFRSLILVDGSFWNGLDDPPAHSRHWRKPDPS
ncbi:hypothetical protein EDD15DRAFT_2197278 [Pisolithus albus]|nr:hypothetical protein EDD15DRAFT_2197278 [Pisolithus albus]